MILEHCFEVQLAEGHCQVVSSMLVMLQRGLNMLSDVNETFAFWREQILKSHALFVCFEERARTGASEVELGAEKGR